MKENMVEKTQIRSVAFDTSFLLKDNSLVDAATRTLAHDNIPCFITATVASELEQLKVWGRITESTYKKAMKRWAATHAIVIDFKNRLVSDILGQTCLRSMHDHGIDQNQVINDCTILVANLKNGIDLFLSEDYHFTSAITTEVISEVKNAACSEYFLMCDSRLFSIDTRTFLRAYFRGTIDLDIVRKQMNHIKKKQ